MTCSASLLFAFALGSAFSPSSSVNGVVTRSSLPVPASAAHVPAATVFEPRFVTPKSRAAEHRATKKHVTHNDLREVFRGLGAWVDLYDYELNPREVTAMLARNGVRTLYLQTGRSNTPYVIHPKAGRWLVAAHHVGIKVVGWYLPYYRTPVRDYHRTIAIKRFRFHHQRFDGLGVDIEFRPPGFPRTKWNHNVARLAAMLDARAGTYPIASIPPPPLQMGRAPGHWKGFPWHGVGKHSDAIMLMSYWSDRRGCPKIWQYCAYGYTAENVRITRRAIGARPVIHIIGGIGDAMTDADVRAFIRGARDAGADGASIYDVASMKKAWWKQLRTLSSLGLR